MNHCVPDFEMEDDFALPTSSTLARPKKSTAQEDEIMELLWQNGQVVMQSQTQRSSLKKQSKPSKYEDAVIPANQPAPAREIQRQPQHLFMQEDEMASWLHYPLNDANFDQDFCNDLLYPPAAPNADAAACVASSATTSTTITNTASLPYRGVMQQYPEVRPLPAASVAARPPIHPSRKAEVPQNFSHFSRHNQRSATPAGTESGTSNSKSVVRDLTVVDSCVTPSTDAVVGRSMVGGSSGDHTCGTISGDAVGGSLSGVGVDSSTAKEAMMITTACDTTVTSSPGCSSASAEPRPPLPPHKPIVEDRKRKGKEEDVERPNEDAEFESVEPKKQVCGSSSKKRSRAAEVHNLSERRRRDRINEKMKALQELIPRCNKSDKASMLDEAIEYLKSLQLQVQMMSMGCSMVPMMFPGIQQYMPSMGMGIGMGMDMGLNRPMMPFPNVLAGAPSSTSAAAAHLCPRFPMPTFHMPPVPAPDPSRAQAPSQPDPMLPTSLTTQSANPPRAPNFADPYQQYLGLHQMQTAPTQNPPVVQAASNKPSTSRGPENLGNRQSEGT